MAPRPGDMNRCPLRPSVSTEGTARLGALASESEHCADTTTIESELELALALDSSELLSAMIWSLGVTDGA